MKPVSTTDPSRQPASNQSDPITSRRCDWNQARAELTGLPGGGLNIAYEALDRHLHDGHAEQTALCWIGPDGEQRDFSYRDLAQATSRFAHLLRQLDVKPGERVFSLLGRIPELYVTALGTLKAGCVFSPLFSVFGPEPAQARLRIGDARVLITTAEHYRRKVADARADLPGLRHVLLVEPTGAELPAGTRCFTEAIANQPPEGGLATTGPEDPALLHFTSGTTGAPKGAIHVHEAVICHAASARCALDLQPGDRFWCTADPGWVTGTSYGIIAPLVLGATLIVDAAEFDAHRWLRILEQQRVRVWYTAPTALRMLMRLDPARIRDHDLSQLRLVASVGEPLNPDVVRWGQEVLGRPVHDTWWQTETGAIMIANLPGAEIRPGSMGKPLPGVEAAIVERAPDSGAVRVVQAPNRVGELALRAGWPSMFRGYLDQPERYRKCFADGWYLSGDLARIDADGWCWFIGRADDMIKSAGHLIGPFEVESALLEHPAVAEAAAIGLPDPTLGELVKVLITLKPGFEANETLRRELLAHARLRLGPAVAPRAIAFRDELPKTRSGKILRRLLRDRELGGDGDLSGGPVVGETAG
jgi:acetyl-CoA synthetase